MGVEIDDGFGSLEDLGRGVEGNERQGEVGLR